MIHARKDYNRMQDPALADPSLVAPGSTPIGADEPVCLFRAQDKHFIEVLKAYRHLVNTDYKSDNDEAMRIINSIDSHIALAKKWQEVHGSKTPDLAREEAATHQ